ncbi:class I SAM-dependent methyltransferase [Ekhidna sp. To15]|uniref:class I SAM-dependent methyltransferase n=1 Tax=Ekhidna sp. To15 TaxID=3395267 RepID=UPI003F526945
MNIQAVNNFFGDMDLFLLDLILKGHVQTGSKVLDIGCGEGRNGIYFIRQGFEYHGWDTDDSKIKLLEYLAKSIAGANVTFLTQDFRDSSTDKQFDLIICSRVLHFATSVEDFYEMWGKLSGLLKSEGVLYLCMDSMIDTDIGKPLENGEVEFPDSKIHFALTQNLYDDIKKGFEEIEPLRTLVHHNERAQSFICLKKL